MGHCAFATSRAGLTKRGALSQGCSLKGCSFTRVFSQNGCSLKRGTASQYAYVRSNSVRKTFDFWILQVTKGLHTENNSCFVIFAQRVACRSFCVTMVAVGIAHEWLH